MKNIPAVCISLLLTMCGGEIFAQTEKGNFLVGGSMGLSHSSNNNNNLTAFSLSPNVSYFFVDNLAAGIMLNTAASRSTTDGSDNKTTTSSISAGPTIRYYFPVTEKFYIFPEMDLLFGSSTSKVTNPPITETTSKTNQTVFRLGAGVSYFIAKNVSLEGFLYYQDQNLRVDSGASTSTSSINFRVGLQVYILRNSN